MTVDAEAARRLRETDEVLTHAGALDQARAVRALADRVEALTDERATVIEAVRKERDQIQRHIDSGESAYYNETREGRAQVDVLNFVLALFSAEWAAA